MRLTLAALVFFAAGCGTLVPYSLAPDVLAPELVPEQPASVLVVTDRTASDGGTALTGRVVDRTTSAPLAARLVLGETALTATDAGVFATPMAAGETVVRVMLDGYAPVEAVVPVVEGERTTVLVLLGAAG